MLKLHPALAPYAVAVLPLVKKDRMPEKAHEIEADLRGCFNVFYDEKGSIGKRYRRMDEAGTPFCITIDGETLGSGTVTLRNRDTMEQIRIPAANAQRAIEEAIDAWEPA